MSHQEKTREQLDEELQRLHQQIALLQAAEIERKQTEAALRASEERFRTVLESLNQGLLITDEREVITYANSQVANLLGYSQAELLGRSLDDWEWANWPAWRDQEGVGNSKHLAEKATEATTGAAPPNSRAWEPWSATFHIGAKQGERRLQRKDGSWFWAEITVAPHLDPGGNVISIIRTITDITERKLAEANLFKRLVLIFEQMSDGVIVTDLEGQIIDWNPAAEKMYGYSRKELLGRRIDFLSGPESTEAITYQILQGTQRDGVWSGEIEFIHKSGQIGYAEMITVPIKDFHGETIAVLGLSRDITERKQAETALKRRNEELAAFNTIAAAVNRSPKLDEVLATALTETEAVLSLYHSEIWLLDQHTNQLYVAARRGLAGDQPQQVAVLGEGLPGIIAKSGQPLHIEELAVDPSLQRQGEQPGNFRTAFGIPLMAQEQLVGVMNFFSHSHSRFTPEIMARLATFGHLIGTAIQNARLFEALQRRVAEQSALLEASTTISSSLDLTTVLNRLAEQIMRALEVTSVYICDWHSETHLSTVLAECYGPETSAAERMSSDLGTTYRHDWDFSEKYIGVHPSRTIFFHVDHPDLPEFERTHLTQYGIQSVLIIPIVVRETVIGYAELWESRRRRYFTPEEIALGQGIAQQGAIAFENARLYETERQQLRLAQTVQAIGSLLTTQMSLNEVFEHIFDLLAQVVQYDNVSVELLDEDNHLYLGAGRGMRGLDKIGQVSHVVSRRMLKNIWSQQRIIVIPDTREDGHWVKLAYNKHIRSWVGAALLVKGRLVGILSVGSATANAYNSAVGEMVVTFANQAAVAIENTRLFEQAQREIAERKRAEETLRESEEKYRILIEQSNDAIYLIYGNKFEVVNHKFEELFGVTQEAANAPDFIFTNIVAPKSRKLVMERAKRDSENQKVSARYEFTALNKDGCEIEVELSVSYPAYRGGLATQGILRDITDRKRAEAERTLIQAQMFQSAKLASMGELAAGVAHEINNPIFVIREYADLILEDTSPQDPAYPMLQTIIDQADRIAHIVRNLLTFARPDETRFSPVLLANVWQLVYNLIGQSFLRHNIQLDVDIPRDLPPVKARSQQLQQVLLNLVNNARDALNEKYPESDPEKRITIKARVVKDFSPPLLLNGREMEKNQVICLTVRDEGIGILPEHREHLFTPFFTTKRPNRGTGLGLSISHKIIENHQGSITVDSEPGTFTEFTVILPVDSSST